VCSSLPRKQLRRSTCLGCIVVDGWLCFVRSLQFHFLLKLLWEFLELVSGQTNYRCPILLTRDPVQTSFSDIDAIASPREFIRETALPQRSLNFHIIFQILDKVLSNHIEMFNGRLSQL
jgi:hypothetical protein